MIDTETGINVETYTQDKASNLVTLVKGENGNYIHRTLTVTTSIVNGLPVAAYGNPVDRNINRLSITEFKERLNSLMTQADAILSDMDALN